MSKKIYIDMDGTLCRFHDTEHQYIEAMWIQGFYNNLKPFENFLNGLSLCIDRSPVWFLEFSGTLLYGSDR